MSCFTWDKHLTLRQVTRWFDRLTEAGFEVKLRVFGFRNFGIIVVRGRK